MADWQKWSEWIKEGHNISYIRDGISYYERIVSRDLGIYIYDWPEAVAPGTVSGPFTDANFEITRGYDQKNNSNHFWQVLFGIRGQLFVYIELPTDLHRHGIPKVPKPSTAQRDVSQFEEFMSPYMEPTFLTEHFIMRPDVDRITIDVFNPTTITIRSFKLRFIISKMIAERIGTVLNGILSPSQPRFSELLDKLYKGTIPVRPITLQPVRMPAETPSGE